MKAIILGGGFSTRLYPLTKYFPKALLPIGEKALMSFAIEDLLRVKEISDIVLVSNHRYAPLFQTWIQAYYPKRITVIDDGTTTPEERLGSIGDILYALKKMKWNDDLLVLSSDVLTSLKLKDFVSFFHTHSGFVNALCDMHDRELIRKKLGCAVLENDTLKQFVEKPEDPKTTLTSIPHYIYPKKSIRLIKEYAKTGNSLDAPGSIIPWLIGKIPTFGYLTDGYYYDVGMVEVYNRMAETYDSRSGVKK
jgi:glucose-1-phosphate thymidylyltransferase